MIEQKMSKHMSQRYMKHTLKIIEPLKSLTAIHHLCSDGTVWATSKRHIIYIRNNKWTKCGTFPWIMPRDFLSFSRVTARIMRADKCNVYVNSQKKIIAIRGGKVFSLGEKGQLECILKIQGDYVLYRSICEDEENWSYLGEYLLNPARGPVRIWRIAPDLQSYEVAYEFSPKSIRHVHGIYADPFEKNSLWVTVGDLDNECHLLNTRDRFKSIRSFGDGTQIWRAVNLFFTETHICWITDSNLVQNYACRMDRSSGTLEIGQMIDCSCWYGVTTIENLHIAFTTVEHGPGIKSDESSILVSADAFNWEKIHHFKKDRLRPRKFFKAGIIFCPSGLLSKSNMYISGSGLVGFDGFSLRVKIEETEF